MLPRLLIAQKGYRMGVVKVRLSEGLRQIAKNKNKILVDGKSIKEIIDNLSTSYNGFGDHVLDLQGNPRRFIKIFVNGKDIELLKQLRTELKDQDEVTFLQAMAGG